jgi:hypothetical protein
VAFCLALCNEAPAAPCRANSPRSISGPSRAPMIFLPQGVGSELVFELPVIGDEGLNQINKGLGLALRQLTPGYALGNERKGRDRIGAFFQGGNAN